MLIEFRWSSKLFQKDENRSPEKIKHPKAFLKADLPQIITYRRKSNPFLCPTIFKGPSVFLGDPSTPNLAWKRASEIVLSRTYLLFWHQILYVAWKISYVTDFLVDFAMFAAKNVKFLFAWSLNLLWFLTTLYRMRSSNEQNAHEGSTKVLQGFHEIVALKNYVNQVFHRKNETFALFFRYSNSIPVLYFST